MKQESGTPASVTRGVRPSRQAALDVVKCMAALLVVDIHAGVPGPAGGYLNAFARIAVPLFFMITGYFYPTLATRGRLKGYLRKLLLWTVGVSTFFLLFNGLLSFRNDALPELADQWFGWKPLLSWLLVNNCPFGGHLWYFYAILYVLAILVIVDRLRLRSWLYRLLPLLLLGNYLLSFTTHLTVYRNFLFTGLPYVLLGCLIRENEQKAVSLLPSGRKAVYGILSLCFLLGVELILYKLLDAQFPRDHYLLTFPLATSIFLLALRHPSTGAGSVFARIGQVYSPYIYMFHPLIITCLSHYLSPFPLIWGAYLWLRPFIVFAVTLGVVQAAHWCWNKFREASRSNKMTKTEDIK